METIIGKTQEIKELGRLLEEREKELIEKHFTDNVTTIQRTVAWRNSAAKDLIARGALYRLMSDSGTNVYMDSNIWICVIT